MSGTVTPGRFVWYDLMTQDTEGAIDFYSRVVGWTLTDWDGGGQEGDPPYRMWTVGEKAIGGLATLPDDAVERGAPPHWLAYVTVEDVGVVVATATERGGEVLLPPTTMAGVGTFAVLKDPQGAVFAPFTPEEGNAPEIVPPQAGEFSWHELMTKGHEDAFAFYSEIFGWEKTEALEMGEMGTYQMYGPAGHPTFSYGGIMDKPDHVPGPPFWVYYVMVDDLDAAAERVVEGGGQVTTGPMEVPGGDRIAYCIDPQGAAFALHSKG